MRSGIVQDKMKLALITCIFKGGDPKLVNNYRPISVLPVLRKLLEKIVCVRLTEYLTANFLLTDCQFRFRAHRTTENAIQNIGHNYMMILTKVDIVLVFSSISLKHSTLLIEPYYMKN